MNEKESPDIFSKEDFAYMATLNERQKRQYKASVALHHKEDGQSIRKVSKKMGTSHDTSLFICDNIQRVWENHMKPHYPDAHTLVVLCDGGGSNSSSHKIVKQDFMELANRINMNILVMHYPPYCSKFNPIEHWLFSQITRSWKGAPLLSIEDAARRAAETTTSKGLRVFVDVVNKTYEINRTIDHDYEKKLKWNVVFDPHLPKWNYLIKRSNVSQAIF